MRSFVIVTVLSSLRTLHTVTTNRHSRNSRSLQDQTFWGRTPTPEVQSFRLVHTVHEPASPTCRIALADWSPGTSFLVIESWEKFVIGVEEGLRIFYLQIIFAWGLVFRLVWQTPEIKKIYNKDLSCYQPLVSSVPNYCQPYCQFTYIIYMVNI